jgi:hypothetical protein
MISVHIHGIWIREAAERIAPQALSESGLQQNLVKMLALESSSPQVKQARLSLKVIIKRLI